MWDSEESLSLLLPALGLGVASASESELVRACVLLVSHFISWNTRITYSRHDWSTRRGGRRGGRTHIFVVTAPTSTQTALGETHTHTHTHTHIHAERRDWRAFCGSFCMTSAKVSIWHGQKMSLSLSRLGKAEERRSHMEKRG